MLTLGGLLTTVPRLALVICGTSAPPGGAVSVPPEPGRASSGQWDPRGGSVRRGPRGPRQPVQDRALPTRAGRSSRTRSGHAADSPAVNCRGRVGLRAGEPEGAPPMGWFVVQIPGGSQLTDGDGGRRGQGHPRSEAVGRCSRGALPTCLGVSSRYPEWFCSAPGLGSGGLPAGAASCQGPGLRPSLSASSPRCPGTGDSSGGNELCPLSGGPGPAPGPTLAQLLS